MAERRRHHPRTTTNEKQFGSAKPLHPSPGHDPLTEPAIAKLCQAYERHEKAYRRAAAKTIEPELDLLPHQKPERGKVDFSSCFPEPAAAAYAGIG